MRKSTSMPSLQTPASLPLNAIRRPQTARYPDLEAGYLAEDSCLSAPRIMALVGMPSGAFAGEDLRQLADREKRPQNAPAVHRIRRQQVEQAQQHVPEGHARGKIGIRRHA